MRRALWVVLLGTIFGISQAHADGYHIPSTALYKATDGNYHSLNEILRTNQIGSLVPGLDSNGNITNKVIGDVGSAIVVGTTHVSDVWTQVQTNTASIKTDETNISSLQSGLSTTQTNLSNEITRATNKENSINSTLTANLNNEVKRATGVEAKLMPLAGGTFGGSVTFGTDPSANTVITPNSGIQAPTIVAIKGMASLGSITAVGGGYYGTFSAPTPSAADGTFITGDATRSIYGGTGFNHTVFVNLTASSKNEGGFIWTSDVSPSDLNNSVLNGSGT